MRTGTPSAGPFSKVSRDGRTMYCKYVELHQAAKCKKCGENKKAKALGPLTKVKGIGIDVYVWAVCRRFKHDPSM